jgi:predicted amidohydrolase
MQKFFLMDQPLVITTIQTKLHWEDRDANLSMLEETIRGIKEKTEVVVLPEMFSTGFSMAPDKLAEPMSGKTVQWMSKLAAEKKIVLTGSVIIEENGNYYNRLIWMLPNGQYGYYDKRHRFTYAGEDKKFTAGNRRLIASVKGWRINLLVCYDLRFPVWSRQSVTKAKELTQPEYDLLIYVANWPDKRSHAWRTLLQARAIENQCYVVGVNRTGVDGNGHKYNGESMVVDPMGEVLNIKKDVEETFTCTLDKVHLNSIREKFPFWRDADQFSID